MADLPFRWVCVRRITCNQCYRILSRHSSRWPRFAWISAAFQPASEGAAVL